jgi:hypothetical protein
VFSIKDGEFSPRLMAVVNGGVVDVDGVDADYLDRVIRHRCGDEIADAVVPAATVEKVLEIVVELQDRADRLEASAARAPSQSLLFN